jgi:hypothetical protein
MKATLRASLPNPWISQSIRPRAFPHPTNPSRSFRQIRVINSFFSCGGEHLLAWERVDFHTTCSLDTLHEHFASTDSSSSYYLDYCRPTSRVHMFVPHSFTPSYSHLVLSTATGGVHGRQRKIVPASPSGVVHVKWLRGTDELTPI